jgi:hypothetical protein
MSTFTSWAVARMVRHDNILIVRLSSISSMTTVEGWNQPAVYVTDDTNRKINRMVLILNNWSGSTSQGTFSFTTSLKCFSCMKHWRKFQ